MNGEQFEREIFEQPAVWQRIAHSDKALRLARAFDRNMLLVGSGSSLFMAELGALALRRRGFNAHALAATEARLDRNAYERCVVIALSQSGRSADLLAAVELLSPRRLIALTNSADSPLAERADVAIDVGAGPELAVPASKSVSATAAILLWGSSLAGGDAESRAGRTLDDTASTIHDWFASAAYAEVVEAGRATAGRRSAIILGSDYGWPIAREMALKLKEASYVHAEGFAAGEFRHGSVAMVDATCAVFGIVDADAAPVVLPPLREVEASGALRYIIGRAEETGIERLGPIVGDPYNTLAWLVTAQLIALHVSRARNVDSDAPRGLKKALT